MYQYAVPTVSQGKYPRAKGIFKTHDVTTKTRQRFDDLSKCCLNVINFFFLLNCLSTLTHSTAVAFLQTDKFFVQFVL